MKVKRELLDIERTTKVRQTGLKGTGRYFGHVGVNMGANFEAHHSHIRYRGGTPALANHAAGYHGGLVEGPKIRSKVIENKLVLAVEALNGFVIDGTANTMISMSYSLADREITYLTRRRPTAMLGVKARSVRQGILILPPSLAVIAYLMILFKISPGRMGLDLVSSSNAWIDWSICIPGSRIYLRIGLRLQLPDVAGLTTGPSPPPDWAELVASPGYAKADIASLALMRPA